jgi:glutamate-1-semialdehyde aminotransferase/acyl carrier protein
MPQTRIEAIVSKLEQVLEDSSGLELAEPQRSASFLELGLDSLFLTQFVLSIQGAFGIKVTFRQLMEDLASLTSLAEHIDKTLPPDAAPPQEKAMDRPAPAVPAPTPSTAVAAAPPAPVLPVSAAAAGTLQAIIDQQLRLMAQQLEVLAGRGAQGRVQPASVTAPVSTASATAIPAAASTVSAKPAVPGETSATLSTLSPPAPATDVEGGPQAYDPKKAFGAIARIHLRNEELTPKQKARLEAFTRRYNTRTRKSKEFTQENRATLADPRVVSGFKPAIKELVYPIVVERSSGSRIWDLDGNEYVDVLNGFGSNFFGYQPRFLTAAIREQMEQGYEIGPQTPLAAEAARLICKLTGHDRAGFCNTGSEAVMGCMRIARTVTGRRLIAIFSGSYHGIFDEVIVRGTRKLKSIPAAPGIMPSTVENVLVLDYGTPESLEILRGRASELAAIMVEPVQSRRPDFQPREFLHELRKLTESSGSALIFDEVITGFRIHQGGAQAHFGIRADIASYGKVIGGGLPIGVIAGKREWMDALDGGQWQFGDSSAPTVGVTYFAGTFVRHPLALAACKASLEFLDAQGPELQEQLNARTERLAAELNAHFDAVGAPIHIKHFGSLWKTFFTEEHPYAELLFCQLRDRGIHIWDGFPCFLTVAFSEADVALVVKAFKESIAELQEGAFLPSRKPVAQGFDASAPPVPGARLGRDSSGNPAWYVPNPDEPGKYLKLDA